MGNRDVVIMVASELYPINHTGGLGIALYRLSLQLCQPPWTFRILIPRTSPHCASPTCVGDVEIVELNCDISKIEGGSDSRSVWGRQFADAVEHYLSSIQYPPVAVVLHDNEAAFCASSVREILPNAVLIYWMHSLYDYPPHGQQSLIGIAIDKSDILIASRGFVDDAISLRWPEKLSHIQRAIMAKLSINSVNFVSARDCTDEVRLISRPSFTSASRALFTGRASLTKGVGFIVDSCDELVKSGVSIRITGIRPDWVHAECALNWLGWLDQRRLMCERCLANLVLSPSITEGFALSVAEAVGCGNRVVAFPVGGLRDFFDEPKVTLVPLLNTERELLYHLWVELLGSLDDQYPIWAEFRSRLEGIRQKFAESVYGALENPQVSTDKALSISATPSWGSQLVALLKNVLAAA